VGTSGKQEHGLMAPSATVVEIPYSKLVDPSQDISQEIIKVRCGPQPLYAMARVLQIKNMAITMDCSHHKQQQQS
jgi:hypothetical protein